MPIISNSKLGIEVFGKKKRVTIAEIDPNNENNILNVLTLDCTVSEGHEKSATVTDHPVEEGSDISDNYRLNPDFVTINGIVSDNPVLALASIRAQSALRTPEGASALRIKEDGTQAKDVKATRSEEAYAFVERLMEQKRLVRASTNLKDYKNMAITNLRVPKDVQVATILDATFELREIVKARTEVGPEPEPLKPERKGGSGDGAKSTKSTDSAVEQKAQTTAAAAIETATEVEPTLLLLGGG